MAKATAQDVNNLFLEYLGRPADPEGSVFYSGKDIEQVAADLAYAARPVEAGGRGLRKQGG